MRRGARLSGPRFAHKAGTENRSRLRLSPRRLQDFHNLVRTARTHGHTAHAAHTAHTAHTASHKPAVLPRRLQRGPLNLKRRRTRRRQTWPASRSRPSRGYTTLPPPRARAISPGDLVRSAVDDASATLQRVGPFDIGSPRDQLRRARIRQSSRCRLPHRAVRLAWSQRRSRRPSPWRQRPQLPPRRAPRSTSRRVPLHWAGRCTRRSLCSHR